MGASFTEQVAAGKTAAEAFARAVADAKDEYGHQEGYSGAINSGGYGFVIATLPPRFTYRKFQALLEEYGDDNVAYAQERVRDYRPGGFYHGQRGWKGNLRKAEVALRKAQAARARLLKKVPAEIATRLDGYAEVYNDKWGDYLAVELRGAEAKRYRSYTTKRRGEKLYIFFGYAPC